MFDWVLNTPMQNATLVNMTKVQNRIKDEVNKSRADEEFVTA